MAVTVTLSIGLRTPDSVTVNTVTTTTVSGFSNAWSVVLSASVPSTTKIGDKLTTSARDYLITNISGSTLTVVGNPFTTTTAPSTGSGATTRSFSSPGTWASGAPANLTTQGGGIGWLWKGEVYKEGTGTDNEWVLGSFYSPVAIATFTSTTDTLSYFLLTAAPGQSFRDNPNKLTNALRYNPANGVAINSMGGYVGGVTGTSSKVVISNLQITIDPSSNFYFYSGGSCTVNSCILFQCYYVEGISLINCVSYGRSQAVQNQSAGVQHINTTFIGDGTGNFGNVGNPGLLVVNCAFFRFVNFVAQVDAFSTNNATDMASFGWTASGNIVSLTYANQFENTGSGTEDFRIKAGSALINAGIRMVSDTNDLDIVGSARSITTPTIGAWEYAAVTPTVTDYSSPLSRGMFRGIERGVA